MNVNWNRRPQNIQEAEELARRFVNIKTVCFKGFDLLMTEDVIYTLNRLLKWYPEIKINFISTTQHMNRIRKRNKRVKGKNYATSWDHSHGEYQGITFNLKWVKQYDQFCKAVKNDVKTGFHPLYCDEPNSVVIHEFAHQLEYYLQRQGVWESFITPLWDKYKDRTEKELSKYSAKSKSEFFAECFNAVDRIHLYYEALEDAESFGFEEPTPVSKIAIEVIDRFYDVLDAIRKKQEISA